LRNYLTGQTQLARVSENFEKNPGHKGNKVKSHVPFESGVDVHYEQGSVGGITLLLEYRTLVARLLFPSSGSHSLGCSHCRSILYNKLTNMGTVEVAGDGVALWYGAVIFLVLSWITFFMRVGVRVWRKAFGMDDIFMLIGIVRAHTTDWSKEWANIYRQILFSVTAALCIVCCYYGSGQSALVLPPLTTARGVKVRPLPPSRQML
jgi:hypothetical protein